MKYVRHLPTFGDATSKPGDWISQVKLLHDMTVGEGNVAQENAFMLGVRQKLTNRAHDWYASTFKQDTLPSWTDFETKFKTEYLGRSYTNEVWEKYNRETMSLDEDVEAYLSRITGLRASLPEDEIKDEAFFNKFITGLPEDLRLEMRAEMAMKPDMKLEVARKLATVKWEILRTRIARVNAMTMVRCQYCNRKGHTARECRSINGRPKGESRSRETRECWYCHRKGHLAKDCRKKKADDSKAKKKPGKEGDNVLTISIPGVREPLGLLPTVINGNIVNGVLDGGAEINVMTENLAEKVNAVITKHTPKSLMGTGLSQTLGTTSINMKVLGEERGTDVFHIVREFPFDLLLGKPWLKPTPRLLVRPRNSGMIGTGS